MEVESNKETGQVAEGPRKEDGATQQQKSSLSMEDKQKLKAQIESNVGTAHVKLDFIDYSKMNLLYGMENIGDTNQALPKQETVVPENLADDETSEPPTKRSKKRNRGMNKKRPFREKRADASQRLCIYGEKCTFGEKCIFSHDIPKLMREKPADLGPVCHNFTTYGKCPRGLMCRYGSSHISADLKNVVDEEKWNRRKNDSVTTNILSKELQRSLWKRKQTYPKSEEYLAVMARERQKKQNSNGNQPEKTKVTVKDSSDGIVGEKVVTESAQSVEGGATGSETPVTVDSSTASSVDKSNRQSCQTDKSSVLPESGDQVSMMKTGQSEVAGEITGERSNDQSSSGVVTDEDVIKLRKCEKKVVDFKDKLFLAPLTTVGNLPFRRLCKTWGADITCGEMAMCTNLLQGQASEWALLKRHSSEDVFGVQIAGAFPDTMTKCAEIINDHTDVNFVDINVGCPIDMVYSKGAGCGLMNRIGRFEEIVRGMDTVLDVPVTVKMRTGVHDKHLVAAKMIPRIYSWGASVVTLHGRTREQRYTKSANWDYIGQCVQAAQPYPLLGNGDILSYEDANLFKETSGVDGVMMARGALVKPWIFTEIKEQRHWDISSQERYDMLHSYVNYGLEHWGSDTEGVEKTRRFLLEWLSFLYRYIPVGLLERPPQRINERPPHYIGRNDLETLMASANYKDWIKISEMLLGAVPESFQFLPKHKANSYS